MSDEEDDYLSDKFLLADDVKSSKPKTYAELRKEALKRGQIKNTENRTKSRKQLELESREDGLSKSLFDRANEDEQAGFGNNKALGMMLKMGFKPGSSLGVPVSNNIVDAQDGALSGSESVAEKSQHMIVPLAINEATGQSRY